MDSLWIGAGVFVVLLIVFILGFYFGFITMALMAAQKRGRHE